MMLSAPDVRAALISPAPSVVVVILGLEDPRPPASRIRHLNPVPGGQLGIVGRPGYTLEPMTEAISPETAPARQLCVVVPTFQERDNVPKLFAKLDAALAGIAWEVIFVDDNSPDGTWEVARQLAQTDSRVRCIRRIGRRGLSGACIEGILASSAPYVAVMDADLQHDETRLPKMLGLLQSGEG